MRADLFNFQKLISGANRHASGGRQILNVRVDPKSLFATKHGLARFNNLVRLGLSRAIQITTTKTRDYAQFKSPEGATGALKQGITGRYSRFSGVVDSEADYSAAVDEGTRPHTILPRNGGMLAIRDRLDIGTKRRIVATEKDVNRIVSKSRAASRGTMGRGMGARTRNAAGRTPNQQAAHTDASMQERTTVFVDKVQHPGSRAIPFFTGAAMVAGRMLPVEANKAIERAIHMTKTFGLTR